MGCLRVLFTIALIIPTAAASTQRLNYGTIIKSLPPVGFSDKHWSHSYLFSLPEDIETPLLPQCEASAKACEDWNSLMRKINALRLELHKSLNDTFHMIQELLPNAVLPEQTQKKRALFSFLGNLIYQVTGLADESQVKQIQNEINVFKKDMTGVANVMNQQGSDLSSFMKTVDDRRNNTMEGIKQNSLETAFLAEKYAQITADLEHFLFFVSSSLDSLKQAILDLAEGKLSPLFKSPQLIETTITSIQNMLIRQYPKYSLV